MDGLCYTVSHLDSAPRKQTYCGPSALSILTGRTAEECAAAINGLRRKKPDARIVGSKTAELTAVLGRFGFLTRPIELKDPRTDAELRKGCKLLEGSDRGWFKVQRGHMFYTGAMTPEAAWASALSMIRLRTPYFQHLARTLDPRKAYLVVSRSHFMVFHNGKLYDNSHPAGQDITKARGGWSRVVACFEVGR